MLNLSGRIFNAKESVSCGSFGSIVPLADDQEEFVAKRVKFRKRWQLMQKSVHGRDWCVDARFSEVEQVIMEFAIAKVCSMLAVGPRLKLDIGFDLVCYRDCIEFYMERC